MPYNGPYPGKCVGSEDCTRPVNVQKRMMCQSHFILWRRTLETRTCELDWCDKKLYSKGLCHAHYEYQRSGKTPVKPEKLNEEPMPQCTVDFCDRDAKSRTNPLCNAHYSQKWLGKKEFSPIREMRTSPDRPGERNCLACGEWKLEDDFYMTRGHFQSRCKPCYGAQQRANKLARMAKAA